MSEEKNSSPDRLGELEAIIERGYDTYVEVGNALAEIRDSRLYLKQFKTFEEYCRVRWSMGRRRADQYIRAAAVVASLGTIVPKPTTESQARALAPLIDHPERMREVWRSAQASNLAPTAATVYNAFRRAKTKATTGSAESEADRDHDGAVKALTSALKGIEMISSARSVGPPHVLITNARADAKITKRLDDAAFNVSAVIEWLTLFADALGVVDR